MTPQEIKRIRQKLGDTQTEFALRVGCCQATIAAWETGTRKPSGTAQKILQIVEKFNAKVTK